MTDSFVTQCPHCQTSFRVSHAQLSVARGVVRCGACLQVFNAAKQLLEQRSNQQPAPQQAELPVTPAPSTPVVVETLPIVQSEVVATQPPATEPVQASQSWRGNAMDLDNLDLDEELARLEQREIQLPETFGRESSRNDDTALSARRDGTQTDSDDWVDSLHNDDVSQLPELHAEVIPEPEILPEAEANSRDGRTEPSFSPGDSHLDDDEPTLSAPAPRKTSSHEKPQRFSALDHDSDEEPDEPLPEPRSRRERTEPGVRDQALLDLTDDPLQLDWQPPKSRWGRKLIWTLLTLIALVGLAGQYVWYHFDELARQDQYRPWFQMICPQIDCKVPSKVDIKQLKSSNLVVRSHPEFKGALVVDAIIYNRASFSQPFPLLELRFADTSGQLIASRRFKPAEYLSGEIAGKEEMPPQTPIHIALDILDPGAKAVNYSLSFRSPE
ncbi:DUF3426 domain-containing protein [Pseudomonas folii]|uniref:DUF3426 domain-containing protein n=1 Tax=Pseudomonas folii TaxID=2762593 RepID=A0ABR7B2E6_9PSED|nr:DUF3426 domain-containing protein [Pseudomonas folii]MBC3951353.1 DUF3426 domain-containing protein [Pseudomonas folii]